MIFGGGKWGDVVHGLWRKATGKVTLANGSGIDLPGAEPQAGDGVLHLGAVGNIGGAYREGDCVFFKSKSAESESETPAENGGSWLNYGLLTGAQKRLYGTNLGAMSWLVNAGALGIWMATVIDWGLTTGPRLDGSLNFRIRPRILLKTFGRFGEAASQQLVVLPEFDLPRNSNLETDPNSVVSSLYFSIDDVSSDGFSIIAGYMADCDLLGFSSRRSVFWLIRLDLSVTDGTFSGVTSLVADASKDETPDDDAPVLGVDGAGNTVSFSAEHRRSVVVGACFSQAGTVSVYRLRGRLTLEETNSLAIRPVPGSSSMRQWYFTSMSAVYGGEIRLLRDDLVVQQIDISGGGEKIASGYRATITLTDSSSGEVLSTSTQEQGVGDATADSWADGNPPVVVNVVRGFSGNARCALRHAQIYVTGVSRGGGPGLFVLELFEYGGLFQIQFFGQRYCNKVFGIEVGKIIKGSNFIEFRKQLGLFSEQGDVAGISTDAAIPFYVSQHPVTGQIIRSTSPICFV